jgi:hypothetical protein
LRSSGYRRDPCIPAHLSAYAYTINVDDGIENNSDFRAILPYHKIRRPRTSQKLLYKIHGDALFESSYVDNDQQNIVFSRSQYLQAITEEKNADIYGPAVFMN